jgi:hypothetical protein
MAKRAVKARIVGSGSKIRGHAAGIKAYKVKGLTEATALMKKSGLKIPPGHSITEQGLIVPLQAMSEPVPANKLYAGLAGARDEIKRVVAEFATAMTEEYNIKEIAMQISYSADGKFLGFGVGGAASITVKIGPSS